MALTLDIKRSDGLITIDDKISLLHRDNIFERQKEFKARLTNDKRASFFKDIWAAMAVASGISFCEQSGITAWGVKDWRGTSEEDGFAFSLSSLIALQRNANVSTDSDPQELLNEKDVIRRIVLNGGLLSSGRYRSIVELDTQLPVASAFSQDDDRQAKFFDFVRRQMAALEVGPEARRSLSLDTYKKESILTFLYELHTNASEHGKSKNGVRLLRLQKHAYPERDHALTKTIGFDELEAYIKSKPKKPSGFMFNLLEASISDFGPGIIDGFLGGPAGVEYRRTRRTNLITEILHERLSSKLGDPNAGLGTMDALTAANCLGGFVSLRTGEFWLTLSGNKDSGAKMTFRKGNFPKVIGTHWQLLLPDWTLNTQPDLFGA